MSAPLTDDEVERVRRWVMTCREQWWVLPRIAALLDEVEAGRAEPGDRYPGGDEHTERCRGLGCPCWREGRGETGRRDGPVCDGSGWATEHKSFGPPCPGCSACHKDGGGGGVGPEAARSCGESAASPAAVREAAEVLYDADLTDPSLQALEALRLCEDAADALAAAGLLRPEPLPDLHTTFRGRVFEVRLATDGDDLIETATGDGLLAERGSCDLLAAAPEGDDGLEAVVASVLYGEGSWPRNDATGWAVGNEVESVARAVRDAGWVAAAERAEARAALAARDEEIARLRKEVEAVEQYARVNPDGSRHDIAYRLRTALLAAAPSEGGDHA